MINRLDLIMGKPLTITNKNKKELIIKHPTINDIQKIGEGVYMSYISVLTISKLEKADELWFDQKIWYEDIDDWDLIRLAWESEVKRGNTVNIEKIVGEKLFVKESKLFHEALKFFTGEKFQCASRNGEMVFVNKDGFEIDSSMYYEIREFLLEINFMPTEFEFEKGGNKITKKFLMEQTYNDKVIARNRIKRVIPRIDLSSIISTLTWINGMDDSIINMPLWKIYEGYRRVSVIKNWNELRVAYYSNSLDSKKRINWTQHDYSRVLK